MTFVTKDSGQRIDYSTGMRRDTQTGKPRFDLLLPALQKYDQTMIYRWAELMARGAVKYGERNWEKAATPEELSRFMGSALRHMMQWLGGVDDGEDHASAVFFNIAAAEYVRQRLSRSGCQTSKLDRELKAMNDGLREDGF